MFKVRVSIWGKCRLTGGYEDHYNYILMRQAFFSSNTKILSKEIHILKVANKELKIALTNVIQLVGHHLEKRKVAGMILG